MTLATVLALGRVSNLPTVWTNCLAGAVLAGGGASPWSIATTAIALSLFYCGGMFLNDAFDREVDAVERPRRPIPSGRASAAAVFALGTAQLVAGLALLTLVARAVGGRIDLALVSGVVLALAILAYDAAHGATALAPWLMAACRALVYVCAATATTATPAWPVVMPAAAGLAVYTAGITYVSRVEASGVASRAWPVALLIAAPVGLLASSGGPTDPRAWAALAAIAWILHALSFATRRREPDVPGGVMRLIAGMCVLDAAWIAATGAFGGTMLAALALIGLPVTRLLQRRVAGS
jgi:4-hydroxybenzoate polyprenyltransferase